MSSTAHNRGSPSPTSTPPAAPPSASPSSSYLSYPVSHVVSSLYRRLTDSALPPSGPAAPPPTNGVYTPPRRTASPFQPPPLTPLSLRGFNPRTSTQILSRTLAEEIRLLLPPRLQLADSWMLAYSLEEDGVSLGTLYHKCASANFPPWSSFVLVVRDAAGGVRVFRSIPPAHFHPRTYTAPRSSAPTLPPLRTHRPPSTARGNVSSGAPRSSPAHRSTSCHFHPHRPHQQMPTSPAAPPSPVPRARTFTPRSPISHIQFPPATSQALRPPSPLRGYLHPIASASKHSPTAV